MRALISDIVRHAAHLTGLSVDDITGPSRLKPIVRVRQAVCLIAREQLRQDGECIGYAYSFPQIGQSLGGRDHSTVIHACRAAQIALERDPDYADFVARLREAARTGRIFASPTKQAALVGAPTEVPRFRIRLQPAAPELERCHNGKHVYTLDHNGDCKEARQSKRNMQVASQRLASAILEAQA